MPRNGTAHWPDDPSCSGDVNPEAESAAPVAPGKANGPQQLCEQHVHRWRRRTEMSRHELALEKVSSYTSCECDTLRTQGHGARRVYDVIMCSLPRAGWNPATEQYTTRGEIWTHSACGSALLSLRSSARLCLLPLHIVVPSTVHARRAGCAPGCAHQRHAPQPRYCCSSAQPQHVCTWHDPDKHHVASSGD